MVGSAPESGLVVRGLSKAYEGTWALQQVSLSIQPGEVLALVGHNGAGKSTLLRSLSGAERPDQGSISVDGAPVVFTGPTDATDAGIACVYQELSLVDQLTVAQNLFLGREDRRGALLDRKEMNREADRICADFGIDARSGDTIGTLPVAQRQMIEVARAVSRGSRYLLLDEPTTALEQQQIDHLLEIIRTLAREQGLGVLLVDHKLDEVFAVADHIVGLSNGRVVLDGPVGTADRAAVVAAVVGEQVAEELIELEADVSAVGHRDLPAIGRAILEARHLAGPRLADVSLTVHEGEILGVYGLVGSGRTRFLRTVYGAEPITSGTLNLAGEPFHPGRPGHAIHAGIAFVSEERKSDGFIPLMSARENVVLPVLDRFRRAGILTWSRLHESADDALSRVSIRGDVRAPISSLSGGNQQKALFARATLQAPRVLLLDEPTKGVDIGAKAEIYSIIEHLARAKRVAVIVVSSEEEELLAIADRITVFRSGVCAGDSHDKTELTQARLRELAWTDADTLANPA